MTTGGSVLVLGVLLLLLGCSAEGSGPPAGPARRLSVTPADLGSATEGIRVERWQVAHPAGALEVLVARPAGPSPAALGLLANRAIHGGADTLRELLAVAGRGHALVAADWYRAPLPAGLHLDPASEPAWRRQRALAWMEAVLVLARDEFGVSWGRCWLLGGSRGSTLVADLAVRRPELRHLALVAPVPGPGGGMAAAVDAVLARGGSLVLVSGSQDPGRRFQETLRERAGGGATWVDLEAPHRFAYAAALDAGLGRWLETRLVATGD